MAEPESTGRESVSSGQIRLERLYLKDASFESPSTPEVFGEEWKPEVQVDINTRSNSQPDNRHEVLLTLTLRAKLAGGKTAFIVEIQQAGIFLVEGVEAEVRQRLLATTCPNTLFPYIRENVDSLIVKGGFPAMHLAPVNFDGLYTEALRQQAEGQDKSEGLDKPEGEVSH
ncbi:MAG: protein-export chaperone SecB [Gammaproteobacteria bacterium]|nr:MAG: protein-export chaperone SecB [Gammaproteobacteria bacterium]